MSTDKIKTENSAANTAANPDKDPVESGALAASETHLPDPKQANDTNGDAPREHNGPKGPEPTRYGDWEQKGRCSDF